MLDDKGRKLLKKLAGLLALRDDPEGVEIYEKYYRNSTRFIVAKIKGQAEFIPEDLLIAESKGNSKKTTNNLIEFFGEPLPNSQMDKHLAKFYRSHSLKRSLDNIEDEISYYTKSHSKGLEKEENAAAAPAIHNEIKFFSQKSIKKCTKYAGEAYMVSDPHLRAIGKKFGDRIVIPTNYWAANIELEGFEYEQERYWQVAGAFKKFTWAKFYRKRFKDKKVFFAVGVDIKKQSLFMKIDCQRTGSNKMSTELIERFDYFLANRAKLVKIIQFTKEETLDWVFLISSTNKFFDKRVNLYDEVIDYLWNDEVDTKLIENKFVLVHKYSANNAGKKLLWKNKDKTLKLVLQGIVDYETKMLAMQGRKDLIKNIKILNHENPFDIKSITNNEKGKWIKCVVEGNGIPISKETIEASKVENKDHYLYYIMDYNKKNNSGKLMIKKGRFDKMLKLEPVQYNASIKF